MKKRFVVMTVLIVLFCCILFRTSYATAASIPFFRLDNTSYLAGEMIEISTFNIENIEGKKYIEILWEDTGNTIFRTEIDVHPCARGRRKLYCTRCFRDRDTAKEIHGNRR